MSSQDQNQKVALLSRHIAWPCLLLAACAFSGDVAKESQETSTGPQFPGAPPDSAGLVEGQMDCYYDSQNPGGPPIATVETAIESIESTVSADAVHVRVTLSPSFCDNTYGENAIGWTGKKGHTFEHLVKSDRINVDLSNGEGSMISLPTLDYLSKGEEQAYESLGVWGSEGEMRGGDISYVLDATSSMDRNLNERGYSEYTLDSPLTDEDYAPNPLVPNWDYRMVYEVWVALDAFGSSGFGAATVDFVHCSPAKGGDDKVDVVPEPCPDDWSSECSDPEGCEDPIL